MLRVVLKGHYQRLRRQYLYFCTGDASTFVLVKQRGVFGVVLKGD